VASIVVALKYNDSTFTIEYTLKADTPWLDIKVTANWLERGSAEIGIPKLCLRFPINVSNACTKSEVPFGEIVRDMDKGQEIPALRYISISGKSGHKLSAGLIVLNDSTYSYSLNDSTLRATLVRSSYEPDPLPELGEHEMRFAIAPQHHDLTQADILRSATAFNLQLQVVNTDAHQGILKPDSPAFISSQPDNVVIMSIKKAEDEDAIVIRLLETAGKTTKMTIQIDAKHLGKINRAYVVDLIEKHQTKLDVNKAKNSILFTIKPYATNSIKISLKELVV
jgi:alpha-mannosidase